MDYVCHIPTNNNVSDMNNRMYFLYLPIICILFFQCSDNAPSPSKNQLVITYPNGTNKTIPLTLTSYIDKPNWIADISASTDNNHEYIDLYYSNSIDLENYNGTLSATNFNGTLSVLYNDTTWQAIAGNINIKYHAAFLTSPETTSYTFSNGVFTSLPGSLNRIMSGYVYAIK